MAQNGCVGVIIGNRGFFPSFLAVEGRKEILSLLESKGIKAIIAPAEATQHGAVTSYEDAQLYGKLFRDHAEEIDGIIISLPNFGDEKSIAQTIRFSGLNVPVMVQAYPDDLAKLDLANRRDSFCGKFSACANLRQYGIDFSLTDLHTVDPKSEAFARELDWFMGVCRVTKGLRNCRVGAVGARPADFDTVRYSEKILEANRISVEPIDLFDLFGKVNKLGEDDPAVQAKLGALRGYCNIAGVPDHALMRMARFATALSAWVESKDLDCIALQCWSAIEENYGITPCAVMSMMSNSLIPAACEVDVTGALSMYALQLANGTPATILDWNNNYGHEPDKCVLFHCSNAPKVFFDDLKMSAQDILADSVGRENSYGTCVGRFVPMPVTLARLTTDDVSGEIRTYLAEGALVDDPLNTFGGVGVLHVEDMQELLRYCCVEGFEHHVAMGGGRVGDMLAEAFGNYLGWDLYYHKG